MRPTLFGITAGGTAFDPDAQAFITAAGITDGTQKTAINDLVVGLKADSLWTTLQACYPFVGGTASAHKYNLKDPQDTNGAYRLSFVGGWTHNATGATPNGTTGYANTFLAGSAQTVNSVHYSFYSGTTTVDAGAARFDVGAITGAVGPQMICATSVLGGTQVLADNTSTRSAGTVADGAGFFISSRTGNTALSTYRNGTSINTNPAPETTPITDITDVYYLGARNWNGAANNFSQRLIKFASFGTGLSGANVTAYNTLVQAFQTAIGR